MTETTVSSNTVQDCDSISSFGKKERLQLVVKYFFKLYSMNDLTTYGALSCELAFLHSFAICFTLVDQSVGRIEMRVVMPTYLKKQTRASYIM